MAVPALPLSTSERDALRRGTRKPLIFVLVTLLLALLLPQFTQRRVAVLRDDINNFADPARLRLTDIQLQLALQGSQRRGFLLSGDQALAREFERSRERRVLAERELLGYARHLDQNGAARLTSYITRLARADSSLDSVVASGTVESARAMDAQRAAFVAIQHLSDTLATKVDSISESRRSAIGASENFVALSIAALLLLGLAAAFLVERLGARFRALALRLEEQEGRFRQITENLSTVVLLSDPDFQRHLYVNNAYQTIWDRSREVLAEHPESFMEGVHPDDRAEVRAALDDVARRAADLDFRVVQPGGDTRWVWGRWFPVRDQEGRVFRIAGIIEDVTERRRNAEEREQLLQSERAAHEMSERRRSELERVTESRARLVRGFTHDVKNPLGAADGYLSLLEDGLVGELPERQRGTIAKVRKSIRHALELIAHLLDLARAEAGQLEIRRCATNVGDEVREVADAFVAQAGAKQLAMDVAVDAELPIVETDPARLRQVVGNLISNAVKYTPSGGHINVSTILAAATTTPGEREIHITVSDDGPGIPADKLPLLFSEFTRFDPGAAEGAGIGLAISKRIAQALGGDISVAAEVGRGASFVLQLPVRSG